MSRARVMGLLVELRRRRATRWCRHLPEPKQAEFLALTCQEALFGGAAGGGKSNALLMDALQHADVPGYSAILFRRTYADLAKAGALMDRAAEWLQPTAARWNETKKQWRFPSGAVLSFGHMENDKDRFEYMSAEYQYIGWDELTHWPNEVPYRFMFTRLRRLVDSPVPLRVRAATNPGGLGHDWVAKRFGLRMDGTQDADAARDPKTGQVRVFVPSKLKDNRYVDEATYRQSLSQADEVTRQQQEDGLWVRDGGGLIYPVREHNLVNEFPGGRGWIYVLGVDLGSSEKVATTAFVVLAYHPNRSCVYVVESEKRAAMMPATIAQRIQDLETLYGEFESIVVDQGGLGGGYIREFQVIYEIGCREAEKKNKLGYRKDIRGALERKEPEPELLIVEPQNEELLEEMSRVEWATKGAGEGRDTTKGVADHATDALLYGWRACKPYLHEPPDNRLEPGTAEALEEEAAELKRRDVERASQRGKRLWWAR